MRRLIKPAFALFAVIAVIAATFALYLSPLSAESARSLTAALRARADITGILPGVFTAARDDGVYFMETYDASTRAFANLFVHRGERDNASVVAVADSGSLRADANGNAFLVLQNGARYRAAPGAADYTVVQFENYALRLPPREVQPKRLPLRAQKTANLWRAAGRGERAAIGELHWRAGKILMPAVLMLFALAFSQVTYRKNRFPGMLPALLVYFAYSNLLGLGVAVIGRGAVNPHLVLPGIHLAFLFFALLLFYRRERHLHLGLRAR